VLLFSLSIIYRRGRGQKVTGFFQEFAKILQKPEKKRFCREKGRAERARPGIILDFE
jgi:hypothetical protein